MIHRAASKSQSMWRLVVVLSALAILVAACSSSDADKTTTTAADGETPTTAVAETTTTTIREQPEDASSFFSINEIGLGPDGYVSLTNFTDVPVRLASLVLVQGSDSFELPDVAVEPGDTVLVAVGDGEGLENVVATDATLGDLAPADGEIALYTSQEFDDPTAMIVYLEWGSTPHDLNPVAIEAGLWLEGSFAPTSATATRLFRVEESGLWLFE
jgi:ABC-type transport system substrate-binding protein